MITVRTLKPDEPMPQHLDTGFEQMPVMKDFVWIAEQEGKVIGALMASPCHGLIFLARLRLMKNAPLSTVTTMFRKCIRDCLDRGFKGYFTFIDPSREIERKMIPICMKAGGVQVQELQVGLVGSLGEAARF